MSSIAIRLLPAEKRRFVAVAKRRGLTLSQFLLQAARGEVARSSVADWVAKYAGIVTNAPPDLSMRTGLGCQVNRRYKICS
jgi:hypothetical protein